ncbi:MAG: hypothetical protein P8Y45_19595 [Exilibacterium sp.]
MGWENYTSGVIDIRTSSGDHRSMLSGENASQYALQKPQLKNAKSQLAAAEADLELAKHMLEKTYIRAPFDGRIKSTRVGVGQ